MLVIKIIDCINNACLISTVHRKNFHLLTVAPL